MTGLYQVQFKLRHSCPFGQLSAKFPDMEMQLWCNRVAEIMEIHCPDTASFQEVCSQLKSLGEILYQTTKIEEQSLILAKSCKCQQYPSVVSFIDKHDCLYLPPTRYKAGWEFFNILAFPDVIDDFFEDLKQDCELEILHISPIFLNQRMHSILLDVDQLSKALTQKQRDAILLAYEEGYYLSPRKTRIEDLATKVGISRPTYEEHLRKAENKIAASLLPLLSLLANSKS
jgi:predicted DNA binding protein